MGSPASLYGVMDRRRSNLEQRQTWAIIQGSCLMHPSAQRDTNISTHIFDKPHHRHHRRHISLFAYCAENIVPQVAEQGVITNTDSSIAFASSARAQAEVGLFSRRHVCRGSVDYRAVFGVRSKSVSDCRPSYDRNVKSGVRA